MERIGILCASETELSPFLKEMIVLEVKKQAMLEFYIGRIQEKEIVAVESGICKVNAAIATQILIDTFQIKYLINAGTAGGIEESINLFDTVVSEKLIYHDVTEDILTQSHPYLKTNEFEADNMLVQLAKKYQSESKDPIYFGTMVSGEQFITDEKREEIKQKYSPLCVDMESVSCAHVCFVNHIPFLSVRTITDTASHKGLENFSKNCKSASFKNAKIVQEIIKKIKNGI